MGAARARIFIAILVGVILVGGAFWMNSQKREQVSAVAVTPTSLLERKHIPIADSDNDRIPDWQNQLIATEPIYVDSSSTEPYELPDTLTAEYSVGFYADMVTLDAFGVFDENKQALIDGAIAEMEERAAAPEYTRDDLTNIISTRNKEALRAYGNLVGGTIYYVLPDGGSEYDLFTRMTLDNNPKHLEKLASIEVQYETTITELLELEVPETYIFEHLAIVNALSEMKQNVVGMQRYFDDPFYTAMRYRRKYVDVVGMSRAIHNLHDALYLDEGIEFAEGDALRFWAEALDRV